MESEQRDEQHTESGDIVEGDKNVTQPEPAAPEAADVPDENCGDEAEADE